VLKNRERYEILSRHTACGLRGRPNCWPGRRLRPAFFRVTPAAPESRACPIAVLDGARCPKFGRLLFGIDVEVVTDLVERSERQQHSVVIADVVVHPTAIRTVVPPTAPFQVFG